MPYSERQLRCLSAMGLVAWCSRVPTVAPPVGSPADPPVREFESERPAVVAAPELAPSQAPVPLATPLPREPAALATWLPSQPLAPFLYRERTITRVGRDDAPLLVVVERAEPADGLPLIGDAAELFERMLRAIGLTRRDTCQCVLADAPQPDGDSVATLAGVAPRRAMLVLSQELDDTLDADGCRLDAVGADAAWCLPHPDRLLVEPLRKRQAWLVMKALRRHLASGA